MKYMGSKRSMLTNGLGQLIRRLAPQHTRFVDLFCGSGSVAWYAAENTSLPVIAVDLQQYGVVLAGSVVTRTEPLDLQPLVEGWLKRARRLRRGCTRWTEAKRLQEQVKPGADVSALVSAARGLCQVKGGPVWNAYGGHYYSPQQALTLDYLMRTLPQSEPDRTVCLAATICAASMCAAAPGHTAQPFQPTATAGKYVLEAWGRDPLLYSSAALQNICPRHATTAGRSVAGEAVSFAASLKPGDLVMVDPPYSEVQYSRFYHVLETIARGKPVSVEGRGRYPTLSERPQSDFCSPRRSEKALAGLLDALSASGVTVILTFPNALCSNGLSGDFLMTMAKSRFHIEHREIAGRFSTLGGGGNGGRESRQESKELLLALTPKKSMMHSMHVPVAASFPVTEAMDEVAATRDPGNSLTTATELSE